jgi:hypothetical protein
MPEKSSASNESIREIAACRPSLLADLESRQEEVLRQLDNLNRRIEQAVNRGRLPTESAAGERPSPADAR